MLDTLFPKFMFNQACSISDRSSQDMTNFRAPACCDKTAQMMKWACLVLAWIQTRDRESPLLYNFPLYERDKVHFESVDKIPSVGHMNICRSSNNQESNFLRSRHFHQTVATRNGFDPYRQDDPFRNYLQTCRSDCNGGECILYWPHCRWC